MKAQYGIAIILVLVILGVAPIAYHLAFDRPEHPKVRLIRSGS